MTVCFDQETSLHRIVNGLELHHKLVEEIGVVLSSSEELRPLLAGVRDLCDQVKKVMLTLQPLQHHHISSAFNGILLFILKDLSSFQFTCLVILNQNIFPTSLPFSEDVYWRDFCFMPTLRTYNVRLLLYVAEYIPF